MKKRFLIITLILTPLLLFARVFGEAPQTGASQPDISNLPRMTPEAFKAKAETLRLELAKLGVGVEKVNVSQRILVPCKPADSCGGGVAPNGPCDPKKDPDCPPGGDQAAYEKAVGAAVVKGAQAIRVLIENGSWRRALHVSGELAELGARVKEVNEAKRQIVLCQPSDQCGGGVQPSGQPCKPGDPNCPPGGDRNLIDKALQAILVLNTGKGAQVTGGTSR